MRWLLIGFATWIRSILSLRYQIKDNAFNLPYKNGILFLSNHQSQIDTLFIATVLGQRGVRFRPLIVEYVYRMRWLKIFIKWSQAIPIPNFEYSVNQYKKIKGELAMKEVSQTLKNQGNILLYPSGKMKRTGKERIGGTSAAYNLIQENPSISIVLIRISGLWGSRFSRALSEELPIAEKTIIAGIKAVLKNFILFTPRRKIDIEIGAAPASLYQSKTKLEFNQILENWYNQYPAETGAIQKEEPLQIVPLNYWHKKPISSQYTPIAKKADESSPISTETVKIVSNEIARILNQPSLQLSPQMHLSTDLGMDSLNIAELTVFLARRCKTNLSAMSELETVQDVLEIAEGHAKILKRTFSTFKWPQAPSRPPLAPLVAKHLPGALFELCQRMGNYAICADDRLGVLSYKKFWQTVRVLSEHFKSWPDRYVAVLLPASVGTYLTIFALQLAKKVPVMLNWTLGPRYLEQMMELSKAQRVLTSWAFIDRLQHVDFGNLVKKIEFLEDIRNEISLKTKWKGLLGRADLSSIQEDDDAVILFTSGSESSPKGVPLTHRNLIANFHSLTTAFPFDAEHISCSALPPFHSLGFSVTGICSLLVGIRTVFSPDPTDAFALAEGIKRWQVTHIGLAPTFLKALLNVAKKEDLESIQILMTGGERTPSELFSQVQQNHPHAILIEGYGVTECSPCIASNTPNIPHKGVGPIVPGVEVIVLHPETQEILPIGAEGEICVSGKNVFKGYLGNVASPFIEKEGKQWYRTGDIGSVDRDHILSISGRLKRFVKLGGEMISLTAVEDALKPEIHKLASTLDAPLFAVCSEEKESGKSHLILFTKVELTRDAANTILQNAGFSHLIKLDRVEKVAEIPLFGNGKINYRQLMGK